MKKQLYFLLLCGALCLLPACGDVAGTETLTPSPAVSAQPTPTPAAETLQRDGVTYRSLSSGLEDSGIEIQWREGQFVLTEKGLEIMLEADKPYLYRRGYLVAVLGTSQIFEGETLYLEEETYRALLEDGTLFNDILFFKDEVATALEQSESEPWKSILAAVELPRSMNVSTPNLDVDRVFQEKPLSDYPAVLAEELTAMGMENPTEYTYSEYILLTESRSVEDAGLTSFFLANKELENESPAAWTVREYKDWQQAQLLAETEAELTEEQRKFLEEKGILLSDLQWLKKDFYGSYMERTDEELRATIEAYYQMSIGYVTGAE